MLAALLTNIYDAAGFLGAAVFSYYAVAWGGAGHWAPLLQFMAAITVLAGGCMALAMPLALRSSVNTGGNGDSGKACVGEIKKE